MLKSWLWTCVIPLISSSAVFVCLHVLAQLQVLSWLPFVFLIWAVVSLSATFILNSLASVLLIKKGRLMQLVSGLTLAFIVPFFFMVIDRL